MEIQLYKNYDSIPEKYVDQIIAKLDFDGFYEFLNDPFTFNIGIVVDKNDNVVGAGLIRVINEFKMIVDDTKSNFIKAKATMMLIEEARKLKQCNGILLDITKDPDRFSNTLRKHYVFDDGGIILRMES